MKDQFNIIGVWVEEQTYEEITKLGIEFVIFCLVCIIYPLRKVFLFPFYMIGRILRHTPRAP